ncbi:MULTISPECIES: response regulator [Pseudoalteromonas]|uniref:response regulator n=1 Tax=Pseudoalteromonas TaxID=53246 RepID=UPI0005F9BAAE|nr:MULTISPECIES: response regulator [Pseudoalteromonas]KJZ04969.1 chemotaxis protein CheY [Pseudoalteromonas piscicida]TMN37504.1 DNA-binding response regulator [Pseudoalteromonas sp. S2755]
MKTSKMLIVEDDERLQKMLKDYFTAQGFNITVVGDGSKAVDAIYELQPDIVLLDLMLPGVDGLTICRQARKNFQGKILILTASDDDFDHVVGLEIGADDYVTKPIKPRVLLARVRSLLRRPALPQQTESETLYFGKLKLERKYKHCEFDRKLIHLTESEFDLLWLLATRADEVVSRDELTKALRGIEYDGVDRTIDNRIVRVRKLLSHVQDVSKGIQTVRGKGYLFDSHAW